MEQFREDYHTQSIHSVIHNCSQLNLFVPARTLRHLTPLNRWDFFGVHLVASGYINFPWLYQREEADFLDEVNALLKDRVHPYWKAIPNR